MGNMKFKVGDRVQIKSIDWYNENKDGNGHVKCGIVPFDANMQIYCGSITTIYAVDEMGYDLDVDWGQNVWTDEMIEGLVEEESIIDLTVKGEEIKERIEIAIPEGYEYVIEYGKIIFTKKEKEYPKTYEECCRVLGISDGEFMFTGLSDDEYNLFDSFVVLKRCRDAYWKIAGEEMGLGKPWEPDYKKERYVISRYIDEIVKGYRQAGLIEHFILEFPTEEMRDAFKENFKEEIEICKELL